MSVEQKWQNLRRSDSKVEKIDQHQRILNQIIQTKQEIDETKNKNITLKKNISNKDPTVWGKQEEEDPDKYEDQTKQNKYPTN
jgi:hypothetical protein